MNKEEYKSQFKAFEDILKPDFFSDILVRTKPDGTDEKEDVANWYNEIASITLHESVPAVIREQYDVAKSVLLYSWYSYRMRMVAWLYSYSVLENALREKFNDTSDRSPGLKKLLKKAIRKGLLNDNGFHVTRYVSNDIDERREGSMIYTQFEHIERSESERANSTEYVEMLSETIPKFRNMLAHGEHVILSNVSSSMFINAEIINMMFKE